MAVSNEVLEERITQVSNSLQSETNKLQLHMVDALTKINTINTQISSLTQEDVDIHNEIHEVNETVESNESRLTAIENKDFLALIDEIKNSIDGDDDSLQKQLDAQDVEHHEELHLLANKIDDVNTNIDLLKLVQAGIPDHVVLSETEYEALGTPDPNKFYFTYEED